MTQGLRVVVQDAAHEPDTPTAADIRRWVRAAARDGRGEVTVRIVTREESAELNSRYRSRQGATNVLAFESAADIPALENDLRPLGDLVVCAEIVAREAREQAKTAQAHWAHIVVHGALHLMGYDHDSEADAAIMESRERELLADLGFPDPYPPE